MSCALAAFLGIINAQQVTLDGLMNAFFSPHTGRLGSVARRVVAALLLVLVWALSAEAQWGHGNHVYVPPPSQGQFPGPEFTFCTIRYHAIREEPLGFGWNTDYPDAGSNFMSRLEELTTIPINKDASGQPVQVVCGLTDPALFDYPYVFMSDVGTVSFSDEEVVGLRDYLMRGGFLHVDDFWGPKAWDNWVYEISKVLPPEEYRIEDIPLDHDIFNIVFDVKEVPQVPSIQWWEGGRSYNETSERGDASREPHIRGIWSKDGRLMVLMSHNTDLADGWEKEREDREYFERFSVKMSYPLGINIVVYALTH